MVGKHNIKNTNNQGKKNIKWLDGAVYDPQLKNASTAGERIVQSNVFGNLGLSRSSSDDSAGNSLICKNSRVYLNSTLKGGFKAGNYTNYGRVVDMSQCIKLCCGNPQCNAALMLERNCFFVECRNDDGCQPVKAKTTHALTALNPKVSFITSRSEEGNEHMRCLFFGLNSSSVSFLLPSC